LLRPALEPLGRRREESLPRGVEPPGYGMSRWGYWTGSGLRARRGFHCFPARASKRPPAGHRAEWLWRNAVMRNRRELLLTLIAGIVAAVVIITPVIAEELFGVITKIDGGVLTVTTKDGDTVEVKTTGSTEVVTGKGDSLDLEKLEKLVKKAQDAGKKGAFAKVTHEGKVASKITVGFAKKKEAN
jgi:hypothetical protein